MRQCAGPSCKLLALFGAALSLLAVGCQELSRQKWNVPPEIEPPRAAVRTKRLDKPIASRPVANPALFDESKPPESTTPENGSILQVSATEEESDFDGRTESWLPGRGYCFPEDNSDGDRRYGPIFAHGIGSSIFDEPPLLRYPCDENGDSSESGFVPNESGNQNGGDYTLTPSDGSSFNNPRLGSFSFKDDLIGLPCLLWDDAKSLCTWQNAIVLGAAAGGAVAIRNNFDKRVRYETAEHPLQWGQGSVVLRQFGEFAYQVPVIAGVYAVSLWTEDERCHEFSMAVVSAYSLSAATTVAIKGITNTQRPSTQFENGHYGFPSYHASSTFCIAAVLDEYYGWKAGLPAYVLAGLVGWSRIDQREHDLSDVVFGSILGFVIGKSVAAAHLDRNSRFRVTPYYEAQNRTTGVTIETKF